MKLTFFRRLSVALLLFLITVGLVMWKRKYTTPSPEKIVSAMAPMPSRMILAEPSPLNQPSTDELREFPGATVVEADEVDGPEPGKKTRLRILKTHFKYPAIRTEEVIDISKNSVVLRQEMVADHFLVTLANGEDPQVFLRHVGPLATSITKVPAAALLYRVKLNSSSLAALPAALHKSSSATAGVSEPNFIAHGASVPPSQQDDMSTFDWSKIPNNSFFNQQWGLWQPLSFSDPVSHLSKKCFGIDALDAWQIRTDAPSIIAAIIDTGIRYTHEDLAANMWHNPDLSAADHYGTNALVGTSDPLDDSGHGTHCAGIVGAVGNNTVGTCGVAWKIQLMACKSANAQDMSTYDDNIAAIDYAKNHGAKILNCSWGGTGYSQALLDELTAVRDAGVIVVACAMNDSRNNDEIPTYPASYKLDNILAVAAMGMEDELTDFSNYGPTSVHLGAPGLWILSTWNANDSDYMWYQGTSMAAPFVVGSLALLAEEFPMETYHSLIARLLASTDKVPGLEGKTITGGRLNLFRALTEPCPLLTRFPSAFQN